jgi:hypothetical protein
VSAIPQNEYSVNATLNIATTSLAAAQTAAAAAVTAINTALTTLDNGTELSVVKEGSAFEFNELDAENGSFSVPGALLVGTVGQAEAQSLAKAAAAAIVTALSGTNPVVTVTLESESADSAAEGGYVFSQLG